MSNLNTENNPQRFIVNTYSKKMLRQMYNISHNTLISRLNTVPGLEHKGKRIFLPSDVELIFSHLGAPVSSK